MASKLLHYDVIETLGEGARSTIYRVCDPSTRRVYALKHVLRLGPKDLRFIEQMETEFQISRQFTHPSLRRSYELKIKKSILQRPREAFLLMELVEGKPLDACSALGLLETTDAFIQVAQGLRAMHAMGYIHCDMKPNNIIYSKDGKIKLIDFGQSCKGGTIKERIQGTPDFIAPEQVARRPVNIQTDVFNFGATLYWTLTRKPIPTFYTVNTKNENSFLLDSRIDTPQDIDPQVPAALSNLVMECIATRPQKRPADMDQILVRLELAKHILEKPNLPVSSDSEFTMDPDDTRFPDSTDSHTGF